MHGGANRITSRTYDTGASFYEDCIRLKYPIKTICTSNIINHMKGGSWINANAIKFINDNMQYLNVISVGHNTISFCIVNFNTTDLTNACIKSICKVVKNKKYKIIIFDASDKTKFMLSADVDKNNVIIINNTHNEIIDIDSYVNLYGKVSRNKIIKTHPSLRHAITIQWMLDNIATNDFVLMDSDVILKKDIDEFVDRKYHFCNILI